MPKTQTNSSGLSAILEGGEETGNQSIIFPSNQPASTFTSALKLTGLDGVPTSALPLVGELAFDEVGKDVYVHVGAGTWNRLYSTGTGDVPTLAEVLTAGATTGANDISVNSGQAVSFAGDIEIPSTLNNSKMRMGYGSVSSAQNAMAFGTNANASGIRSMAFGYNSESTNTNTISFGEASSCTEANSVTIGAAASVSGPGSVRIGTNGSCTTTGGTSVGENASVTVNDYGTAVGYNADTTGLNAVAIGKDSKATADNAVAILCNNSVTNTVKMSPSQYVLVDSLLRVNAIPVVFVDSLTDSSGVGFTITANELLTSWYSISGLTGVIAITFPTFAQIDSALAGSAVDDTWSFRIENADSTYNITLTAGANGTFQPSGNTTYTLSPGDHCQVWFSMGASAYQMRVLAGTS